MNREKEKTWFTIAQMVADLDGTVSEEKVRTWCRNKKIGGVINVGDGRRAHFRVPKDEWDKFKRGRSELAGPRLTVSRLLGRSGTNHLGV